MKTAIKISSAFVLTFLLFTFSCSNDDDSDGGSDSGINAQNLVANFDENPNAGASIGTIQAASSNTLSFSITSQTPAGAININASTGELTVANEALFDFETNPVISATISIINSSDTASVTATINLNNLDDLASILSTSLADYTAAANGDWVVITEVEYNNLATMLNEVSKIGCTDLAYDDSTTISNSGTSAWIASNVTTANIPNNSYVYAFKYYANSVTNSNTSKIKVSSTNISDGYSDLGSVLPTHSGTSTDIHFVLKGNSTLTSTGYIAFYKGLNVNMGLKAITGNQSYYWASGDSNSGLSQFNDYKILYQGLSTTQKQW